VKNKQQTVITHVTDSRRGRWNTDPTPEKVGRAKTKTPSTEFPINKHSKKLPSKQGK
jgi:hypothetical protein